MKPEKFMQAMGEIKPEIIEDLAEEENEASAAKKKSFKLTLKKSITIAACFVFIIALAIMIPIIKSQTDSLLLNDSEKDAAEAQTNNSVSYDGIKEVVIDNRPFTILPMFVYGDTLYFGNPNDDYYLYSCNINNPSKTIKKISNTKFAFRNPVTDGENIYYIKGGDDEQICSVNLSGETLKILYEDKDVDPYQNYTNLNSLSIYKNKLYYTLQYSTYENITEEHVYCCLMCYDINTKNTTTLKQFELSGQLLHWTPITYTIDNDIIYFAHENLYTCNLDGSNEKVIVKTENHLISYPQIKNRKLYYQIENFSKTDSDRMAFVRSDLDGNNKVFSDIILNASRSYKMSVLDNGYVVSYVNDHGLSLIDIDKGSVITSYQDLVPEYYLTAGNKIFALKRYESFGMYEDGNVEYIVVNENTTSSN